MKVAKTLRVVVLPEPHPDTGPDQLICSHEVLTIRSNSYNENYRYNWSPGNEHNPDLTVHDLAPGNYDIRVDVEACGQHFTDDMMLTVKACQVEISNVITPNGDGHNDYFVIKGLEHYPGSSLIIIDRNGRTVFETSDYHNDWKGDNLPDGTYFYILRLNDKKKTEKGGSVTVLRK